MIKYGFQTYTWQMSFDKYAGNMDHIVDITKRSGLKAVEAEIVMLKDYFDKPDELKRVFSEKDAEFKALCLVCDWLGSSENREERLLADKAIEYTQKFDDLMLVLCQMPQADREDLSERQKNALSCINSVAKRAFDSGVKSTFHPNSPGGSVFRTYEDYTVMLNGLDDRYTGFTPDSGHIIKGGINVYDLIKDHISVINHFHFKDIDENGNWCVMGEGITDFRRIVDFLKSNRYDGYIMIEDESLEAEIDPDDVALKNAGYITKYLM